MTIISYKGLKTCRYLMRFSYIGTNYEGLQRQTNREEESAKRKDRSIQFQIETAIENQLRPIYGARMSISSRTDSGVHALVNSCHIDLTHPLVDTIYKPKFITDEVNKYLYHNREQIRVLTTQRVGNGFSARNSAKWRSYLYRVAVVWGTDVSKRSLDSLIPIPELDRCYVVTGIQDVDGMKEAVDLLKGCHDFASFTPRPTPIGEKKTIRDSIKTIIDFDFKQFDDYFKENDLYSENDYKISLFTFELKSKSFLYNQVRRMIGSVLDVGLKRISVKHIEWLLDNPHYNNWYEWQSVAPSRGLWLKNIYYDSNDLRIIDENGIKVNSTANSYPNYNEISHFFE